MFFSPLNQLLAITGLKHAVWIALLTNCALFLLIFQTNPLTVAIILLVFNAYLTSGLLLLAARDITKLQALLSVEAAADHETFTGQFSNILTASLPGLWARIRYENRSSQEQQDFNAEIGHSAQELLRTAEHLSSNIESQSMATTSIAAAVTEISHSVDDISERMKTAYQVSKDVDQLGQSSRTIIESSRSSTQEVAAYAETSYELLTSLDTRTKHVASMSSVIRDIAEQTNLLALNAAIEAARAGESGRGFAVVAEEVRALALRSQESAKEISENIDGAQQQMASVRGSMDNVVTCTEHSVQKAKEAEDILNQIVNHTHQVSDSLFSISSATEQQTTAVREISNNIEQVAVVADENSSIAKQSAAIANHLHTMCSQTT